MPPAVLAGDLSRSAGVLLLLLAVVAAERCALHAVGSAVDAVWLRLPQRVSALVGQSPPAFRHAAPDEPHA